MFSACKRKLREEGTQWEEDEGRGKVSLNEIKTIFFSISKCGKRKTLISFNDLSVDFSPLEEFQFLMSLGCDENTVKPARMNTSNLLVLINL